jgi:hypothetical protein
MATNSVIRSILLATGVLLIAACATQPAATPGSASVPGTATSWANTPLLEKKFQREANNYQQYQFEGQTVYCQRGATRSMPKSCFTEAALRKRVELFERDRNGIARGGPPYVATVPGG